MFLKLSCILHHCEGYWWLAMHIRKLTVGRGVPTLSDGAVHRSSGWSAFAVKKQISTFVLPHNPLNLNFPHTDWSSCSKPGWWTSCKHANRKGYHRPSRTGCPQGFWAEWREIKNWGICSTDEGSLVALGVVNESTFKVRQIGEACFCHLIYSM